MAIIRLESILFEAIKNGLSALSIEFLTQHLGSIGLGNWSRYSGALITVGIAASIVPAPIGVLAGIYLSEFVGNGPFPHAIRFFNDVLTGLPSIVLGVIRLSSLFGNRFFFLFGLALLHYLL